MGLFWLGFPRERDWNNEFTAIIANSFTDREVFDLIEVGEIYSDPGLFGMYGELIGNPPETPDAPYNWAEDVEWEDDDDTYPTF